MVSTAGGWIIIAILIFVFVIFGILYWYWNYIYIPQHQVKLSAAQRNQPPASQWPAPTPPLT